jgi:hypothetical protein
VGVVADAIYSRVASRLDARRPVRDAERVGDTSGQPLELLVGASGFDADLPAAAVV